MKEDAHSPYDMVGANREGGCVLRTSGWPILFAGSLVVALCATACQATSPSNAGFVPGNATLQLGRMRAATKSYLYATTLDWNKGTGSVYYYDAYGKNTSSLGSLPISDGFPDGVWTDSSGNVYVGVVNSTKYPRGYINVYTPAFGKLLRTYTSGLDGPSGGTFDATGNMYVANLCGTAPSETCFVFASPRHRIARASSSTSGYVAVYPPGKMQPSEYLESPINIAVGVALDSSDNVFVVNNTGGSAWGVVKFPAGSRQGKAVAFRGLPKQLWIGADTFAPDGALVISANSAIDYFPHEQGKPARSRTDGVVAADGLSYGPDGTLFAGNYEYISNEGNTIAFPPGSKAPARTYKVPYGNGVVSIAIGTAAAK